MQFTPQQLSGGPKFSSSTRIGNWQEEVSLEEAKLTDFRKRSNHGNLAIRQLEGKMSLCTQRVGLSSSEDGIIRFGDVVQLEHQNSGHLLACDPFEDFMPGSQKYFVSCTGEKTAVARSTFRITRLPAHLQNIESDPNDDTLRIGQAFALMCNEALLVKPESKLMDPPLYLSSTKKNERNATKTTNRQLVFMSSQNDADCVWVLSTPSQGRSNASERYLCNGRPANINDTLLITHRQTNCCLVCDPKQRDHTDFGVELECYADRTQQFGKLGLVVSEFKGLSTPYTLAKPDAPHYFWRFVMGDYSQSVPSTAAGGESVSSMSRNNTGNFSTKAIANAPSNDDILYELQYMIRSKGIDAFWNLRSFFISGDVEFDGKIDRGDLKDGLMCWGITMDHRYIDRVIDMVDSRKTNGVIDFNSFSRLIRGELPGNRVNLINQVWDSLSNGANAVAVDDLKKMFNCDNHPLTTLGAASDDTVWKQFRLLCKNRRSNELSNVNLRPKVIVITRAEFSDYYADLSAGLSSASTADKESDDYFELVITSNWGY